MPNSSTPLSDCISRYAAHSTWENYEAFLQVFLTSRLGIILTGIPPGVSGQYVAGKNELQAAMCVAPDGMTTLLACADRAIFVQRFNQGFNAEMAAIALLRMAWSNPNSEAINGPQCGE